MKKYFHNYERFRTYKRDLDAMNLVHALCNFKNFEYFAPLITKKNSTELSLIDHFQSYFLSN